MTITLYDCATAPSPRRARILLAEKGVPHETVQVDLRSGEQMGEAFVEDRLGDKKGKVYNFNCSHTSNFTVAYGPAQYDPVLQ